MMQADHGETCYTDNEIFLGPTSVIPGGDDFSNIWRAAFSYKKYLPPHRLVFQFFWQKNIVAKAPRTRLVKLTIAVAKSLEGCQLLCLSDPTCVAFFHNKINMYCYPMQQVTGTAFDSEGIRGPKYCNPKTGTRQER